MIEIQRKYTAGPWQTNGYDVRQPVGRYVAYCGPHHTPDAEYPLACKLEDQANARLIAAAPELLDALRLVVDHGGTLTGADWNTIHAAIHKAEGEDA